MYDVDDSLYNEYGRPIKAPDLKESADILALDEPLKDFSANSVEDALNAMRKFGKQDIEFIHDQGTKRTGIVLKKSGYIIWISDADMIASNVSTINLKGLAWGEQTIEDFSIVVEGGKFGSWSKAEASKINYDKPKPIKPASQNKHKHSLSFDVLDAPYFPPKPKPKIETAFFDHSKTDPKPDPKPEAQNNDDDIDRFDLI